MNPNTLVENLPGIGTYLKAKLEKLEIRTLEDLIYHFPTRYDDYSQIQDVTDIIPGEKTTIVGSVWQIKNIRTPRGKFLTTATVADQSGTVDVIWFNQPYLTKNIKIGMQISLAGKAEREGNKIKMISPTYEIAKNQLQTAGNLPVRQADHQPSTLHTGRLVPIYPETEGLSSKWFRNKIANLLYEYLKNLEDFLPEEIKKNQKLISLDIALKNIHLPKDFKEARLARERLAFEELFLIQLKTTIKKNAWIEKNRAKELILETQKVNNFIENLPFKLTNSQLKATKEILEDLAKKTPANRLLEGDVGSGKTVVAAIAAFVANQANTEVIFAAPTEILAFQHQKTLEKLLEPYEISVGIWTGSRKKKGEITVGTHALLSTFTPEKEVGLVIVDEQHRFGVAQRAKMFIKKTQKLTPHLLTMTATPIPRTLALTLYGDLDLSVLDEMPVGRQTIATFVVPNNKRGDAYKFIEKQVLEGKQAFILTPFVEPSETMSSVKSATLEFEKLKTKFSKKVKLGLLHGRLKSKEKEEVIKKFEQNKINILVTTPVVEVGIDIPNATIMMIESAERFGLAQLHQLRGRVGRGEHKSYCLLFSDSSQPHSQKRLKSLEKVFVGFELAEIDLKMRGPGEIFGFKQSGFTNLKIADLNDEKLIAKAQIAAKEILKKDEKLQKYPLLANKIKSQELEFIQPN